MKKILAGALIAALLLALTGCGDMVIGASQDGKTGAGAAAADPGEAGVITLKGDSASYPGGGVSVSGSTVTVSAPGEYILRGTLDDGRIVVNTGENPGDVILTLDGADITCLQDSAIYVAQAKNVDIVLAAGSENRIVSGTETDLAAYDPTTASGAAIYAEDDLDIKGEGALTVYGYLNNAITCKDDLDIMGGTLTVTAANNGIRASESVCITAGTVTVDAGNDGVKSTSAVKEGKGYVEISGGSVTVRSGGDGISAETELRISGGAIDILTSGNTDLVSSKGLKARTDVVVSGGEVRVDATDIGVKAKQTLRVLGGALTVAAGEDGLRAGSAGTGFGASVGTVEIAGGTILVSAATDPIDARAKLTVSGGTVLACGSSKTLKGFSADSAQPFIQANTRGEAGSALSVADGAGAELGAMTAAYGYNTVLFSSSELTAGQTYTIHAGSTVAEAAA